MGGRRWGEDPVTGDYVARREGPVAPTRGPGFVNVGVTADGELVKREEASARIKKAAMAVRCSCATGPDCQPPAPLTGDGRCSRCFGRPR